MTLTESYLSKIIREAISRTILNEGISKRIFHFTSLQNAYKMLSTDTAFLQSSYAGRNVDNYGGKPFYMCFTRNKHTSWSYANNYRNRDDGCRIEFDGDLLNADFKGLPVDYWKLKGVQHANSSSFETEDRIVSDKAFIKNISRYIKRVDLLCIFDEEDNQYYGNIKLASAIAQLPTVKDKTFIYDNIRDFDFQTKNTIQPSNETKPFADSEDSISNKEMLVRNTFSAFLPILIYETNISKEETINLLEKYGLMDLFSETMHSLYPNAQYKQFFVSEDSIYGLSSAMKEISTWNNSEKGQRMLQLISDYMRKNNYSSIYDWAKKSTRYSDEEKPTKMVDIRKKVKCLILSANGKLKRIIPYPYDMPISYLSNAMGFNSPSDFMEHVAESLLNTHNITHKSKSNASFIAYMKHAAKKMKVSQFLTILDKFNIQWDDEDVFYEYDLSERILSWEDIPSWYESSTLDKYFNKE